jgi:hypothetical protein
MEIFSLLAEGTLIPRHGYFWFKSEHGERIRCARPNSDQRYIPWGPLDRVSSALSAALLRKKESQPDFVVAEKDIAVTRLSRSMVWYLTRAE